MSPIDSAAAPPWALLDTAADDVAAAEATTDATAADVAAEPWRQPGTGGLFGGVVELDAAPADGRVGALRSGLRAVPDDVAAVVYLDEAPREATGAVVAALFDRLGGDDDAVVAAVPVTDALKRVEGDRVVSSVDRRGLYRLGGPQVLRRPVLAAVLRAAPDVPRGPVDPAVLLLAAGRRVRVVPVDPAARGGGGG